MSDLYFTLFYMMVTLIGVVTFIFAIAFLVSRNNLKSKYSKYHFWSIYFLVLGSMILFYLGISAYVNMNNRANSSTNNVAKADGFTINEYKIEMKVSESNSIDIKEYITVNFYNEGHHGIYRYIPSYLEYTNKDGVTEPRKSEIKDLKAIGESYTIEDVNGKKKVKIGSPSITLPIGDHSYEIDYTYDMGEDPYTNYDEFIFHAFGDYWGTEIKNASIIISLPKSIDSYKNIKFFADKFRKNDITSNINYEVDGNTIKINVSPDYRLEQSLTIDIELPDGFFKNGSNNYGYKSLIICLFCISVAVITVMLWNSNGKDYKDIKYHLDSPQYSVPDDLDAAEIGYLYKHDTGRKLTVALIIELASKGFIKIDESEDKKKITIKKTVVTDINKAINRKIKIIKLKEYKSNFFNHGSKEEKIMQQYFPDQIVENYVLSDYDKFYNDSKALVDKGYITIEHDSINDYSQEELEKKRIDLITNEFKYKPKMSSNEEIVYNMLFTDGDETILSENNTFYQTFNKVALNVKNTFDDKINDINSYKYMLLTSFGYFICAIAFASAYGMIEDLHPNYKVLYLFGFIANIVIFIFSILMKRKNTYGEEMKKKISSYRKYLDQCEKEQIESLAETNPNYYYDVLPYAYVLGISKKWTEKFGDLPMAVEDLGTFNFYDYNYLSHLSKSIHMPSSSGGGSSSCGGGCSSCGGGCSSCGGGGSW